MNATPPRPSLPAQLRHKLRCLPFQASRRGMARAGVLIAVHLLVLVHVAHWKLSASGETLTPVEPSESMLTLELGYVNAGFVLFVVAILATMIFGRFFCGWACHVVAYQDLCAWILGRFGLRPRPLRSRLLVLVPLGAAFYMFVWPTLARIVSGEPAPTLRAEFLTDDLWQTFPGPWMAALTLLVDGFLIVWFLGAKGFCTYGCPYGAVFGLADRVAKVRVRVTDACEGCGHCTAACTSNVDVAKEVALHRMVVDPGCMKCLDCVSVCPKEALYVGSGPLRKSARTRPKRTYDLSWGEELFAVLAFGAALLAFRNLYGAVPFLLAIGLAVITAVIAIAAIRTLRGSLAFQHLVLRGDSGLTRTGAVFLGIAIAWLAFAAHSGAVKWRFAGAEAAMSSLHASPTRDAALRARDALLAVDELALFADPRVELGLASLHRRLGDLEAAVTRARRAVAADPRSATARLLLADVQLLRGDHEAAGHALEALLEREPDNETAKLRLSQLRGEGTRIRDSR
jgi:polyferredoxin